MVVETDAGLTGLGDAFGDERIMEAIIDRRIGPMSVGMDPTDIDALWRKLFASRAYWETGGSVLCAISAVEVACYDIWAQAEGVPVSTLLGGAQRGMDTCLRERPALGRARAHGGHRGQLCRARLYPRQDPSRCARGIR